MAPLNLNDLVKSVSAYFRCGSSNLNHESSKTCTYFSSLKYEIIKAASKSIWLFCMKTGENGGFHGPCDIIRELNVRRNKNPLMQP